MIPLQPPRSATDLFPESLRLSPKQREVLSALQEFPDGARATEIAAKLGMHVNTARGHLEELMAQQAVSSVTAPAKGRGRPSLIFQVRVPDNRSVAREYLSLIEVLTASLGDPARPDAESLERARDIGRQWAGHMLARDQTAGSVQEALGPLFHRLRDMGFDPSVTEETTGQSPHAELALHSCPFVADQLPPSPYVCAIHEGFIREVTGGSGPVRVELAPFAAAGECTVRLSQDET